MYNACLKADTLTYRSWVVAIHSWNHDDSYTSDSEDKHTWDETDLSPPPPISASTHLRLLVPPPPTIAPITTSNNAAVNREFCASNSEPAARTYVMSLVRGGIHRGGPELLRGANRYSTSPPRKP
ncbi:hypothetical protein Scep_002203 [Stephania cephalantha]|uniref:Uncharacterized protein n=1 Tax=Stephania cephalantha TaxID=152367 RepID=A0AAP0LAZ8_9MAGN